MRPVVFIHGYSAESSLDTPAAIEGIYGTMPAALRERLANREVEEIDLSRWISLEDGIALVDVARALDQALNNDRHRHLLTRGFDAIVHSTGALVIRCWLAKFSERPSPLNNLVYLAGANFGSGWAHIGKGQLAKWTRKVFGTERGVQILDALEFGASETIDLHRFFLRNSPDRVFNTYEHVIIGTQADPSWFEAPIRYAKEDGSDGVIRVAASNLNFNYIQFVSKPDIDLSWNAVQAATNNQKDSSASFYRFGQWSRPGARGRPIIPFAIPYECAHSGSNMGIVRGRSCRGQVLELIVKALETTPATWASRVDSFAQETAMTYEQAAENQAPLKWRAWLVEPRAQYDKHAQVILRIRDQDGRPVRHFDIFFDTDVVADGQTPISQLIETKHINRNHTNIIVFYLRTDAWDDLENTWVSVSDTVSQCNLEISATEPETGEILYMPLRYSFTQQQLSNWIQPHRTTVIDVELQRIPSDRIFQMVRL